jgi:hypothetical protein
VAFDLVQVALICLKFNQPIRPGKVVLVGAFSTPGAPMEVFDSESTPGNERAISCAIEQSRKVKSPPSPPSRFIRYFLFFPGGAKDVRFDFPDSEPARKSP